MTTCRPELLSAYHDGELPQERRQLVEEHLRDCPSCSATLRAMQETSKMFASHPFEDLTADELDGLHESIRPAETGRIFRLAATLAVVAASVLIVSCAWLMELPATSNPIAHPQTLRRPEPWEQVATTLRPDPFSFVQDDPIRLADAALADWMLVGLNARTTSP